MSVPNYVHVCCDLCGNCELKFCPTYCRTEILKKDGEQFKPIAS